MTLIDFWRDQKSQLEDKHVQQIIAFAGEGKLTDGSLASSEFREFLSNISSNMIKRYIEECLQESFQNSGLALQDIVNEIGIRLGFEVIHGRYRGTKGQIGYDGIWTFPKDHKVIVEVKTSDAYRIDLEIIEGYRRSLIKKGELSEENSSILIVVGREDTGDLEAQIRGSRHAWDIRLISAEALLRLMLLKEEVEEPQIIQRIYDILIPREFTKLDEIIEIVFTTAEDVKEKAPPEEDTKAVKIKVSKSAPVSFNDACASKIEQYLKTSLIKRTRASYSSPDKNIALICAVSKHYKERDKTGYWFAFHPHQQEFLKEYNIGYVAFGCGSESTIILIPIKDFSSYLDEMHITEREDRFYWHVIIEKIGKNYILRRKKGAQNIDLSKFLIK